MENQVDILLIEDSASQALRFKLLLERAGFYVRIAVDGAAGWRLACTDHPRLILLDVDLPSMNGFQVLARLKRGSDTATIPVIMLTHREHISNVERALGLGADDYLPKQDAMEQMCEVVKQMLQKPSQAAL